jgi:hypothetical protein
MKIINLPPLGKVSPKATDEVTLFYAPLAKELSPMATEDLLRFYYNKSPVNPKG